MKDMYKHWSDLVWITFVIASILASILFVIYSENQKFDPNEHVCEEWEQCTADDGVNTATVIMENGKCVVGWKKTNIVFVGWNKDVETWRCDKFRDKSKCEKDPNSEGCVCDEWDRDELIFSCGVWENYVFVPIGTSQETVDSIVAEKAKSNEECIEKVKSEGYACISAHEPNECEMEEMGWIWQYLCYDTYLDNDEIKNTSCPKERIRKICRKKTISDFSCNELKEAVSNYEKFRGSNDECEKVYLGFICPSSFYKDVPTTDALILEFIERCGGKECQ